ncbi:hypothetical protein [Adhaeribacter pallidiroseus]|uniref:Uncharacterized protein n=1 Tax=Adhaeribacter pallidiroseus TaxID=2072847 RepID=A0A369Q5I8_9BACT|nr:hypothetical protein [Adhaeribacter pallidiroseus]RDC58775.1 hypothetical protein AHMF7616_05209 [Adhaeribacter pallidiroseus]
MSLANIDLNQYSIVRHRDTDKVYVYETAKYPPFKAAAEHQELGCYALDRNGQINLDTRFTFKKEQLFLQPIRWS